MTEQPRWRLRPAMILPASSPRPDSVDQRNICEDHVQVSQVGNDAAFIRSIIRMRRRRADLPELIPSVEPAWDVMLDIYACMVEHVDLPITAVGIAAGLAPATTQRWIKKLAALDVVRRAPDPRDRRRILVRLTPAALTAMRLWHAEARAAMHHAAQNEDRHG